MVLSLNTFIARSIHILAHTYYFNPLISPLFFRSVEPVSGASLGMGPGARSVTDPHGWEYGTSFDALSQRTFKGDRAVRRDVDTARRRRWTRVRAPIPPPLDDPSRPLSLFLEVARGSGGATEVRASSGIRVENHTGAALEIGCESAAWLGAIIAAGPPVKPNQTGYLPLHLIDTMRLALREVSPQAVEKSAAEPQEPAAASSVLAPALREALATVASKAKEKGSATGNQRALTRVAPGEKAQSFGPLQRAAAGFGAGMALSGLNPVGGIQGATVAANAGGGGGYGDEDSEDAVTSSSDAVRDGWPVDKVRFRLFAWITPAHVVVHRVSVTKLCCAHATSTLSQSLCLPVDPTGRSGVDLRRGSHRASGPCSPFLCQRSPP